MGIRKILLILPCLVVILNGQSVSKKAQKWSFMNAETTTIAPDESTEDDFFNFGSADNQENEIDESSFDNFDFDSFDTDLWDDFGTGRKNCVFFSQGSSYFNKTCLITEVELPPCNKFSYDEIEKDGIRCDNSTGPPQVRHRDKLFERLFSQIWFDYQTKLNYEKALYGLVVDPLDIDALLPEPVSLNQSSSAYQVAIKMNSIKVHGISGINMTESLVTRSENLTDFKVHLLFAFDQLVVNGTYDLKGSFGWWELDSRGFQNFAISMINATIGVEFKLELVDPSTDWTSISCYANGPGFGREEEGVLITDIKLPLKYDDVNFRFDNLGSFANNVVNGIGVYFLQSQEELLVGSIRALVKEHVNSLIC